MLHRIVQDLHDFYPQMVSIRRDFHMYPELSFQEVRTPRKIAEYLEEWGIEVETGVSGNGVVGRLKGKEEGKTIALRADFDALPIQDQKDVPYKSKIDGVMHACGHDVHTASLLGVAKILADKRAYLKGEVVFIFQFAEELGTGGAKPMIEAGCLEGVDMIYGAHVWSPLKFGEVSVRPGYTMANCDGFNLEIIGSGGHGSEPHKTIDPIVAGSRLVTSLQEIVSRRVNPMEESVITIGSFNSGNSRTIIPEKAKLGATIRSFNPQVREQLEKEIRHVVHHSLALSGATYDLEYIHGYPALYNHPNEVEKVKKSMNYFAEKFTFVEMAPVLGAEDFAFYLREKPGVFFFVGGGSEEFNAVYPHHHEKFDVDERAMLNIGMIFLGLVHDECFLS
ncbi:M20 metallopeptidase family protein [Sutcliffiella cohnii]